jgi:hypothetical protein
MMVGAQQNLLVPDSIECGVRRIVRSFMALVGHVQLMYSICDDKDRFLRMITEIFGLA